MKYLSFVILFLFALSGCKDETGGPYFGNGFHNGWADQNSIVIWTRLTSVPELNRTGPGFLEPSADEHRRLDKMANADSIYGAQIPSGYTLDLMEGRNYRSKNTDPDGPGKTIWGRTQKEWLYKTLRESYATFKLVITPGPILGPDRENKRDNYSNKVFAYEGNEIRTFLKQFENVFICNGDRHWQYVTNIPGTTLWEFSCGAGSDSHAGGWEQNDVRPEHRFLRVKGGFLKGSVYRSDNKVNIKFQHCDVDGNVVHEEIFSR